MFWFEGFEGSIWVYFGVLELWGLNLALRLEGSKSFTVSFVVSVSFFFFTGLLPIYTYSIFDSKRYCKFLRAQNP